MSLTITPWICPLCIGGLIGIDEKCLHCSGTGLTNDPMGDAQRAPRPPGVMRTACADCALRRGSPELENAGAQLPDAEPFYCHQGVPVSATGAYTPTAMFRGLPLGLMVCAGWWAMQTGEPLPAKEYREVGVGPEQVEQRWGGLARALEDGTLSEQQVDAVIAQHLPRVHPDDDGWTVASAQMVKTIDGLFDRMFHGAPAIPATFLKPTPASDPPTVAITGILSLTAGQKPPANPAIPSGYIAHLMGQVPTRSPLPIPDIEYGDKRPPETAAWSLERYFGVAYVREFWRATDVIGEPRLTWEEAAEVWDRVQAEQQGGEQP